MTSDSGEHNDAMAAIRETVEGLHAAGIVDTQTMREFDALTRRGDPAPAGTQQREQEWERSMGVRPERTG